MWRASLATLILVPLCFALQVTHGYDRVIYVSGTNPNATDSSECWEGGFGLPCKTLNLAFQGVVNSTQVIIENGEYDLQPDPSLQFENLNSIAFEGSDYDQPVPVNCNSGAGLTFLDSSSITILNIQFIGCGVLHNSTSRDFSNKESFSFLEFQAGLYFLFCKDVNFTRVTVSNSSGTGMVMYSTVGVNTFQECYFSHNAAIATTYPGGGGLYIEFPFCSPDKPTDCENQIPSIRPAYTSNASYTFSNSSFVFNEAFIGHPAEYIYLIPQDLNHLSFGHGGGLSVIFSNVTDSSVAIESCDFTGNKAVWGAGVYVEFQDDSWNNSFSMFSSTVEDNECSVGNKTGGGGMKLGYTFVSNTANAHARHNRILITKCNFTGNQAYYGGGVSVNAAKELDTLEATNKLEFVDCKWSRNMGRSGAAMELSIWNPTRDGADLKPVFTACVFANNSAVSDENGGYIGTGVVLAESLPIAFDQSVLFKNNRRTPLVLEETSADFLDYCVANFISNTGRIGGAIGMWGNAYIQVYNYTKMNFINNTADRFGGAIASHALSEHSLVSFGTCFIQYKDITLGPQNWTSEFYFKGNRAGRDGSSNSIAAISLLPCTWGSYDPSKNDSNLNDVFCWNENWDYAGKNCTEEVMSAPAYFTNTTYKMEAIPGRPQLMPLEVRDDRGRNATDRMVINIRWSETTANIANNSAYIADNTIELLGQPHSTAHIRVDTLDPRVLSTTLEVKLLPCPPGYVPTDEGKCNCGGDYGGLVRCDETNASIRRRYWIGYRRRRNSSQTLVVGSSPYISSIQQDEYNPIPQDVDELQKFCYPAKRKGVLCGSCLPGYGPSVNAKDFECVKCTDEQTKYHWAFLLLSEFLPITIFAVAIVLFNVSATAGPANAFIFFAQIITTTFGVNQGSIPYDSITHNVSSKLAYLYIVPYDIWNLNFGSKAFPSYCLSPHLDSLAVIALHFLIGMYPLMLIAIFLLCGTLYDRGVQPVVRVFRPVHACFARVKSTWRLHRSIIDALAAFFVLSYTKTCQFSIYLMAVGTLRDSEGKQNGTRVVYFDGDVDYLTGRHIYYFTAALVVLIVLVILPPLFLILSPLNVTQRVLSRLSCCGGGKLQAILDTFQGCYKDGTNGTRDYRYFAGVYLLLRLVFFLVYGFSTNWFFFYILQQLVCTIGILLFAVLRPYKSDFYNALDATIFGLLAAINIFSIYQTHQLSTGVELSLWAYVLQYIIIFIPLIYISGAVIWHLGKYQASFRSIVKKVIRKLPGCSKFKIERVDESLVISSEITDDSSVDQEFLSFAHNLDRDRGLHYAPQTSNRDLTRSQPPRRAVASAPLPLLDSGTHREPVDSSGNDNSSAREIANSKCPLVEGPVNKYGSTM